MDKSKPTVYGIGFIGYGIYNSSSLAYRYWRNMLMRITDITYQETHPNYTDCAVCEEWKCLQNFGIWFDKNYIDGYQLDKDLIEYKNKIYSPEKCLFVPNYINKLFHIEFNKTNNLPYGVVYNRDKFRSAKPNKTFNSIIEAKNYFWNNKYNYTLNICNNHPEFKEVLLSYFEQFFNECYS